MREEKRGGRAAVHQGSHQAIEIEPRQLQEAAQARSGGTRPASEAQGVLGAHAASDVNPSGVWWDGEAAEVFAAHRKHDGHDRQAGVRGRERGSDKGTRMMEFFSQLRYVRGGRHALFRSGQVLGRETMKRSGR